MCLLELGLVFAQDNVGFLQCGGLLIQLGHDDGDLGILMIHRHLLGCDLQGLFIQLELLVCDEELLLIQLGGFGLNHGEILVEDHAEHQDEHQQQRAHQIRIADPAGAGVAALACAAVVNALACHGVTPPWRR